MTRPGQVAAIDQLSRCVHCGLCLPTCPTYRLTGDEAESPRGRIHLIQARQEGRIERSRAYRDALGSCLACRACETACPSGVPYGAIIEAARADLHEHLPRSALRRAIERVLFRKLLPSRRRLHALSALVRRYQQSGLGDAVRRRVLPHLAASVGRLEAALPALDAPPFEGFGRFYPAIGRPRLRVALFGGCIMPMAFGAVHEATIRVLRWNGCDVVVPRAQTCCGALHSHDGDRETARALARRNIEAFAGMGIDRVVLNSAGCGTAMKEYADLLADDPAWSHRARAFSSSVADVSELLDMLDFREGLGPVRRRVTIQDACHLVHGQGIRAQPRTLLSAIPELQIREQAEPDTCCGSAGLYSLTHPAAGAALADARVAAARASGASAIVVSNPGCALHLAQAIRRNGLTMEIVHLVEVLDRSYRNGPNARLEPDDCALDCDECVVSFRVPHSDSRV
ncbi:MAG: heterodisulfide reductase-related iron-sulfur binding cluster [Chloroflexota bacterium]